jgi:hypothetical protein
MGVILNHLIKDHGATMAQAKAALTPWKVEPIVYQGKQVGEYMMQNNEIHIALNDEYRLKLGRHNLLKHMLKTLLVKHEFLVTRLFKNDKLKEFIEMMGFTKTHEDAKYIYFWLDSETAKC